MVSRFPFGIGGGFIALDPAHQVFVWGDLPTGRIPAATPLSSVTALTWSIPPNTSPIIQVAATSNIGALLYADSTAVAFGEYFGHNNFDSQGRVLNAASHDFPPPVVTGITQIVLAPYIMCMLGTFTMTVPTGGPVAYPGSVLCSEVIPFTNWPWMSFPGDYSGRTVLTGVTQIAAIDSGNTLCALMGPSSSIPGSIVCSGSDNYFLLGMSYQGYPSTIVSTTSDTSGNLVDMVQLTAGNGHFCATSGTPTGTYCWGSNQDEQLTGVPSNSYSAQPPFSDDSAVQAVLAIVAGELHTCALLNDAYGAGVVRCWGYSGEGLYYYSELEIVDVHTPAGPNTRLTGVKALGGGFASTCGITADGGVECECVAMLILFRECAYSFHARRLGRQFRRPAGRWVLHQPAATAGV